MKEWLEQQPIHYNILTDTYMHTHNVHSHTLFLHCMSLRTRYSAAHIVYTVHRYVHLTTHNLFSLICCSTLCSEV